MANYNGMVRTNYFQVTDEERYQELLNGLTAEDDIHTWDKSNENGDLWHGFGSYSPLEYGGSFKTVKEVMSEIEHPESVDFALDEDIDDSLEWGSVKILANQISEEEQESHYVYHIRNFEDGKTILYISEYPHDYLTVDMNTFYEELQKILPESEAFILQEVGNEKLRYLVGAVTIVTKDEIKCLSIDEIAREEAKKMLNDPEFETQMDY